MRVASSYGEQEMARLVHRINRAVCKRSVVKELTDEVASKDSSKKLLTSAVKKQDDLPVFVYSGGVAD